MTAIALLFAGHMEIAHLSPGARRAISGRPGDVLPLPRNLHHLGPAADQGLREAVRQRRAAVFPREPPRPVANGSKDPPEGCPGGGSRVAEV